MSICDRCLKETRVTIMSKFNLDIICGDCKEKERAHPRYKEADAAEVQAVRGGERNFPGIGKPNDL